MVDVLKGRDGVMDLRRLGRVCGGWARMKFGAGICGGTMLCYVGNGELGKNEEYKRRELCGGYFGIIKIYFS